MIAFLKKLHRSEPVLSTAAWVCAALAPVYGILTACDGRMLLGENVWLKPLKFAFAFFAFLLTTAWYLSHAPARPRIKRIIAWGVVAALFFEIPILSLQAARGVRSHFNIETTLDVTLFRMMGAAAHAQAVLLLGVLLIYFRRDVQLSRLMTWSVRLGIAGFLLCAIPGDLMVALNTHSVGGAEGGAGMPLTHWSRVAGDLRIAHFLGMHTMQIFPLLAFALERGAKSLAPSRRMAWLLAYAGAYAALALSTFVQALLGRPWLSL